MVHKQLRLEAQLISIVIPAYNGESFIEMAVKSVLNQTYCNIEVIVVDDASTDRTCEIVSAIDDKRICLYRNPKNKGPTYTWNRGMDLAQGEYIKLLCHDDVLYENSISIQVDILNSFPDVVLVAANRDIIDSNGKLIYKLKRIYKDRVCDGLTLVREAVRKGTNTIGEPNAVLFRKNIIRSKEIIFGDDFYVIDFDYYAKILKHGDAYLINKSLSAFRVSTESASVKLARKQARLFNSYVNKLQTRPEFGITKADYLSCSISSRVQQVLKMIFYAIYIKT